MLSHVTTTEVTTSWALAAVAVGTTLAAFVLGRMSAGRRMRSTRRAEDAAEG
jgi:ABC-type branched-subunit amino acid transport system permease subunit